MPQMRVYVLWRHQHDDFEILGVFTSPKRFQEYVKSLSEVSGGSRWRGGDGQWILSTPQWEFVASALVIDDEGKC